MIQILKPKPIGKIQGPISAPATASNTLEGINGIIQLLRDAGFVAGVFDAKKFLDFKQDQVIRACRLLYEGLVPWTGEYKHEGKALLTVADAPRGYHARLSQYASAKSDIESDESIGIQRMALGPTGISHLLDRMVMIKEESCSVALCAKEDVSTNIP